jgi:NADPH:quinone reductase-like Zn-dependent oxidoreductase
VRAAVIRESRIEVEERPDPVPGPEEVLIRVRAAGVNGADLGQRAGRYPPPPGVTDVPGLECAGETEGGDRVMALLPGGGQAELAVAHRSHVLRVPDHLGWEEAGGFVEVFATAHDALFTQAQLREGDRLLVNGAAGGVGVAAVQLGRAAGASVTANARHHHDDLRALGADTEVAGEYDVILELVGGENLAANLGRLARGGRIAVIGVGAGARAELDYGHLMSKRARITGSTLRSRSVEEKEDLLRRLEAFMRPHRFRVPVEAAFPLERAQDAYERFAAGGKLGKIVLTTTPARGTSTPPG